MLLDVHMPGGGGLEVIRQVAEQAARAAVPGASVSDAPEDVIAIIRAGARGYVTKTISGVELADAVRRIADGDAVFSPRLAGFVLDAFASGSAPVEVDAELEQLTTREREVLRHIARGYLYKEIAARLGISTKTVEAHVSRRAAQAAALHSARALPMGSSAALGGLSGRDRRARRVRLRAVRDRVALRARRGVSRTPR